MIQGEEMISPLGGKEEGEKEEKQLRVVNPRLGPFPRPLSGLNFHVLRLKCKCLHRNLELGFLGLRGSLGLQWFLLFKLFFEGVMLLRYMTKVSQLSPVSTSLSKFILCFVVV